MLCISKYATFSKNMRFFDLFIPWHKTTTTTTDKEKKNDEEMNPIAQSIK